MALLGKQGADGFCWHLDSAMPGLLGASPHYQLPLCLLLLRNKTSQFSPGFFTAISWS